MKLTYLIAAIVALYTSPATAFDRAIERELGALWAFQILCDQGPKWQKATRTACDYVIGTKRMVHNEGLCYGIDPNATRQEQLSYGEVWYKCREPIFPPSESYEEWKKRQPFWKRW